MTRAPSTTGSDVETPSITGRNVEMLQSQSPFPISYYWQKLTTSFGGSSILFFFRHDAGPARVAEKNVKQTMLGRHEGK